MRGRRRWLVALVAAVVVVGLAGVLGYTLGRKNASSDDASSSGVVVVAAGDIACDPEYPNFRGGEGTARACHEKNTADVVGRIKPHDVLALGDIQYVHGTPSKYSQSYTPSWGRFKDITHPVLGNHEGGEGGTNKQYFAYFGAAAGDPHKGYYSFDIGSWHIIALNSNCGAYSFNKSHDDCQAGSAQERWLKADLASHPSMCSLAYFHVPRFTSDKLHHSDASNPTLAPIWTDLYTAGVDVVLNGHAHNYERFEPLTPQGTVDPQRGIREFVVGTGGDDHQRFGATVKGSLVRNNNSFGVLKLTLDKGSYEWQFVNDGSPGATLTDHGSSTCHN